MGGSATVRAVNRLAARWAGLVDGGNTAFMPAGVWPLLAFLATGAHGPAVAELEDALGMRAGEAADHAHELLSMLRTTPGSSAAVGLWTSGKLRPASSWLARLPGDVHGELTGVESDDRARLDAWAARNTDGLIDRMPVALDEGTRLVLASALTVRTEWIRPFSAGVGGSETGPWAERSVAYLSRGTSLLDRAAVVATPAGPVTELRVLGANGIDVHLLLGEEDALPAEVLRAGLDVLAGSRRRVTADLLPAGRPGPGVTVSWVRSRTRENRLRVTVPAFDLESDHDLLARPEVFGLATATDPSARTGHFRGIDVAEPLFVSSGRQAATAAFGEEGFRAAAVTAFALAAGGAAGVPRLPYLVKQVEVDFDRPCGFLAVHRTSRLVLAAGWVAEPLPAADPWWVDSDELDDY